MSEEKITVREHFVPRVFLRGFSSDYIPCKKGDRKEKSLVWRYSTTTNEQKLVPIASVCYEDNIYEYTGKQGEFVLRNRLEKILSCLESMFGEYRSKLERKVTNESNLATNCFLENKEKDFWVLYITHQILRDPEVIEIAAELSREIIDDSLTDKQSRNIALSFCVPFLKEIDENTEETKILLAMAVPMRDSDYHVIVDKQGGFVTARRPVYVEAKISPEKDIECYNLVIFPVTSHICLALTKKKQKHYMNRLHQSNIACKEDVLFWLSRRNEEIFSDHRLSEKEIAIIRGTRIPSFFEGREYD